MSWEPTLAAQQRLVVVRVGLLKDEARIYLRADGDTAPLHVLRLVGVFKLFDSVPRGQAIQITDISSSGSFGWEVPNGEPHRLIKLIAGEGIGSLMALSREVEYYLANRSEALNWPG